MTEERLKIWLSFVKFFLGAGGIALVSTIINWQIQHQELQINLRNAELQYLERFAKGALHEDLYRRRNFAQYFATVTISEESKARWNDYLVLIENEIENNKKTIVSKSEGIVNKTTKTIYREEIISTLQKKLSETIKVEDRTALEKELAIARANLTASIEELQIERGELKRLKSQISSLDEAMRIPYSIPEGFIGTWEGIGLQVDGSSWSIKLSLSEKSASIDYASLSCGGELTPLYSGSSDRLRFRENILYGIDECVNYGSVVLSLIKENEIEFNWYYPSGRSGARGKLTKK